MIGRQIRRWHAIGGVILFAVGGPLALANYSAPFKEAAGDATVVIAKCKVEAASAVECTAQESIRGRMPTKPIQISRERWANYGLLALDPRARGTVYLLILSPEGKLSCLSDLPILGDVAICVVPIVNGELPRSYRMNYDRTNAGPLTLDQIKSQLLAVPRQTK